LHFSRDEDTLGNLIVFWKAIIASHFNAGLGGLNTATIISKINPTNSVIPIKNGLIYTYLLSGLSKGRGYSNRSSTEIAFHEKSGY
jgi:hypothetical protein